MRKISGKGSKSIGRRARVTLALLVALSCALAVYVYALSVTSSTVSPTTVNTPGKYTIAAKTGTIASAALTTSSTITTTFPAGTVLASSIAAGNISVNGTGTTTAATVNTSTRTVTFTSPVAVARNTAFTVVFGVSSNVITNPSQPGSYTPTIYTSSETTPVNVTAYTIAASNTSITTPGVTLSSYITGASATYTVGFNVGSAGALTATSAAGANTITLTLPSGCTVPTTFSGATVNGTAASATGNNSTKVVTVTIPSGVAVANGGAVSVVLPGITNPAAGPQTLTVYTSAETTAVTSGSFTVNPASVALAATNASLAPANSLDNDTSVRMQRLNLTGTGAVLTSLTMDQGSGTASNILNAYVYISATSSGTILPSDKILIGQLQNWNGASTQINFNTSGQPATSDAQRTVAAAGSYLYIVYDMAQGEAGKTVSNRVSAIGVAAPNQGLTGQNLSSGVDTLSYSGEHLTVTNNLAVAGAAKDSDSAVLMQRFQLDSSSAFSKSLTLSSVTMQDLGDVLAVGEVKIYIDSVLSDTALPATAVQIGSLSNWNRSSVTIPLVTDFGAQLSDMTITAGTPKYLYIVYGMNYVDDAVWNGGTGRVVQADVTAVGAASPGYGQSGLALTSNSITLTRGTWSKITSCGGCHAAAPSGPTALRDGTDRNNPVGTFPGSHNAHLDAGLVCANCHVAPTNYHHANGKIDIGGELTNNYTKGNSFSVSNAPFNGQPVNFGSCSGLSSACHTNGTGGTYSGPVTWNNSATACGSCHGVLAATPPNSTTHVKHVGQAAGYQQACVRCHSSVVSATADSTTAPTIVNSALHARYTSGALKPPVVAYDSFNSGASAYSAGATCNGTYCHSSGRVTYAPYSSPLNKSFTWSSAPIGCAGCHDTKQTGATATKLSGKHDKHMNPTNNPLMGLGNGFNCADCHAKTITNSDNATIGTAGKHVNKYLDYSGVRAGGSSRYDSATKSCSNIYCHSNGNPGSIVYVNMTGSKVWSGTGYSITTCNRCHGRSTTVGNPDYANGGAGTATANLHAGHLSWQASVDTTVCSDCHRKTADPTTPNKFRNYSSLHLSGGTNVNFNTAKSYIGSNATAVQAGYNLTCSQVACHGSGSMVWGASSGATNTCFKCHGAASASFTNVSAASVAPGGTGRDTAGNTAESATRVGSHQNHLANSTISSPIKCGSCHTIVNNVRDASHWNYSTATVTFQGLASANGKSPAATRTGGVVQCSNTYCHTGKYNSGSGMTPAWNNTAYINEGSLTVSSCTGCHGMPPNPGTGNHSGIASTITSFPTASCSCHSNLSSTGNTYANIFVDKTKHINGSIEAAGESGGGSDCSGCHSDLFNPMNGVTTSYHHYVQNAAATYPTAAPATAEDTNRRCLQCHVDHDVFRPDLNLNNTLGRAGNLRTSITALPDKTKAPGAGAGNYTNSDFNATSGGICISCHTTAIAKNQTRQKNDGSTFTVAIPFSGAAISDYQGSSHQYGVNATIATGGSTFSGNCSKCHSDTNTEKYQSGTITFGTHDSSQRRFAALMGQPNTVTDPMEEKMCFRCHSRTTDTAIGGTVKTVADKDWYNATAMTARSQLLYNIVTNYAFKHDVNATSGMHQPYNEGRAANDGTLSGANRHISCTDCHNPHAGTAIGVGVLSQTVSSYASGLTTANDTITVAGTPWTTNAYAGWSVRVIAGTGAGKSSVIYSNGTNTLSTKFSTTAGALDATSKIVIFKQGTSDGNTVSNATKGVWGLAPTWPSQTANILTWDDSNTAGAAGTANVAEELPGQFASIVTWNRVENATIEGMICIKCHSAYAYGATPPNTPSGQPTGTNVAGVAMRQGDKANEFNPNNLGYHPIFARGKNQPVRANYGNTALVSAVNTNWPKYTAGSIAVTNGVATLTGATLPATTLPGWFVYIGATGPTAGAATGASNMQTPGTTTSGYLEITSITSSTQFTVRAETSNTAAWPNATYNTAPNVTSTASWFLTAGLGNTFVPPWGPWSTMQCSDCHTSNTSTDPMGPHGSAMKYLLVQSVPQTFNYWNGTAVTAITNTPVDGDNFCINCHRRDVYGDFGVAGANPTWSRQAHPVDASGTGRSLGKKSKWGPVCMNCHGGARAGGIHGENLGKGNNGAAGSYSGKRLLGGATWSGVTRSTTTTAGTCYVKGTTADAVNNCGNGNQGGFSGTGGTGGTGTAQYQFDEGL